MLVHAARRLGGRVVRAHMGIGHASTSTTLSNPACVFALSAQQQQPQRDIDIDMSTRFC
jgi:hypothetical protein